MLNMLVGVRIDDPEWVCIRESRCCQYPRCRFLEAYVIGDWVANHGKSIALLLYQRIVRCRRVACGSRSASRDTLKPYRKVIECLKRVWDVVADVRNLETHQG
jgi:hypothetical protein